MRVENTYNTKQLRDYANLFLRSEVQAWLSEDLSSIRNRIERYDDQWQHVKGASYLDYLRHLYQVLETHYQNEYVYKNTLLNEYLIKEIGQGNSTLFNEYRVGQSVADLVLFNGCSTAFEIKTELDSDSRLPLQLENYRKAFNKTYLVIPESKLPYYEQYDQSVGLISFNSKKRQHFTQHREAHYSVVIDAGVIMHILHTREYKTLVLSYYDYLPEMTSFNQFNICMDLIKRIPVKELNRLFIEQMKSRTKKQVLSNRYFREFNQLSLALRLSRAEKNRLIQVLKSPLNV